MTWRERAICLDCQRTLNGPGTGPVGPRPSLLMLVQAVDENPCCAFCGKHASPAARLRLWQDDPEDTWTVSTA